jgi:hypothetical protein
MAAPHGRVTDPTVAWDGYRRVAFVDKRSGGMRVDDPSRLGARTGDDRTREGRSARRVRVSSMSSIPYLSP